MLAGDKVEDPALWWADADKQLTKSIEKRGVKQLHMIQNLPEHKVNVGKSLSCDELASAHVSVKLLQLWFQRVFAVSFALGKGGSA